MRGNLTPTQTVDRNGKLTTVYKKPADLASAGKTLPAPKPTHAKQLTREDHENRVLSAFKDRMGDHTKMAGVFSRHISEMSDEVVENMATAVDKIDKLVADNDSDKNSHRTRNNYYSDLMFLVTAMASPDREEGYSERITAYVSRQAANLTIEAKVSTLMDIYQRSEEIGGASDETLDVHASVARSYFEEVALGGDCEPLYTDNKLMFDLVQRYPQHADIIVRHHNQYRKGNSLGDLENDLETLSGVASSVGSGWL